MGKEVDDDSDFLNSDYDLIEADLLAETAEKGIDQSVAPLAAIYSLLDRLVSTELPASAKDSVQLSLAEYGCIDHLSPVDFQLNQSFSDAGSDVSLTFRLTRQAPARIECSVAIDAEDIPALLRREGVTVISSRIKVSSPKTGVLEMDVAGDIPVSMSFRGLLGAGHILLDTRNVGSLGVQSFRINPENVDQTFLEGLEKLLLRGNDHFFQLVGENQQEELVIASPRVEQTISIAPVTADILTFDLSQRPKQKALKLLYQNEEFGFSDTHPVCRLGRRMPADIQIRSRFVSREHATVILENRQFSLRDHSSNGTYVRPDGKPTFMLHHATQKLTGSGVISLGEEISPDNPDLIYYEIE